MGGTSFTFQEYCYEDIFGGDFTLIREFLISINSPDLRQPCFEWGRWEWAHSLPFFDRSHAGHMGIWSMDGRVCAAVLYEDEPKRLYPVIDTRVPHAEALSREVIAHCSRFLRSVENPVGVLISDGNTLLQTAARKFGLIPSQEAEYVAVLDLVTSDLSYDLEAGFRVHGFDAGYDLKAFNRTLWEGFNHDGPAPETPEELDERRLQLGSPHTDLSLKLAAVSGEEEYAAFCGGWHDSANDYALLEPLATRPAFRRRGLARALVLELARRVRDRGCRWLIVGSSQQFYYDVGFNPAVRASFWR